MKELNLITPFTSVNIRSKPAASGIKLLTGRWVSLNSSGQAVLPAAGATGVYLLVEGLQTTEGLAAADFAGTTPFLPTDSSKIADLPSAVAMSVVALAYGIYVFSVAPVGFVIAGLAVGDGLKVDDAGRLVKWVSGTDNASIRIAIVESVAADRLIARTTGN